MIDKEELVKLTCSADKQEGFESAIIQLGYTIIYSSWDDEKDVMYYEVKKKWLK